MPNLQIYIFFAVFEMFGADFTPNGKISVSIPLRPKSTWPSPQFPLSLPEIINGYAELERYHRVM
ncbi:MAG: hypothetical protein K2H65_06385, partial [Bacteroidales bacterium]|nr:hypothetical protein [Bacteroidales bacterium]